MLKKSLFLIICCCMVPMTGFTLGLGHITVYSKLNEPLKVQIELLNSQTTPIDDLIVKNADRNTYKRADLPRPLSFNKVRFKTKKLKSGSIIVELTTKRPVREPFITFIADLKWRTGHINREYTFLLDPPEFIQKQIYASKAKQKQSKPKYKASSEKKSLKSNKPRRTTHKKITYSKVIASHIDGDTYATKRADTLWNIAKKVKPNSNVTTYQTMQALYALNPTAFIRDDINLLKQGQTLKIPTQNEILQINGKSPLKKSSAQNKTAKAYTTAPLSKQKIEKEKTVKPVVSAKKTIQKEAVKKDITEEEAQLKIIPASDVLLNTPVTSKDDLLLINQALQSSISTIKSLQSENEELSQKIERLTKRLNSLDSHEQNLNNKISQMSEQATLEQSNTASSAAENSVAHNDSPAATSLSPALQSNDSNSLAINSSAAHKTQPKSFVRELLSSPIITIALAIFTLLILVAALFTIRNQNKKRKQNNQGQLAPNIKEHNDKTQRLSAVQLAQITKNTKNKKEQPSMLQGTDITDEKDEEDMDFFEYFEKKINAPESTFLQTSQTEKPSLSQDATEIAFDLDIDADEIEAYEQSVTNSPNSNASLSEIDTYIAYGNYADAEKSLMRELQKTPSDKNLHLKLFECFTFANKRYEFIKHAENNIDLLNIDMVLRHRVENIFQQTWEEPLEIK